MKTKIEVTVLGMLFLSFISSAFAADSWQDQLQEQMTRELNRVEEARIEARANKQAYQPYTPILQTGRYFPVLTLGTDRQLVRSFTSDYVGKDYPQLVSFIKTDHLWINIVQPTNASDTIMSGVRTTLTGLSEYFEMEINIANQQALKQESNILTVEPNNIVLNFSQVDTRGIKKTYKMTVADIISQYSEKAGVLFRKLHFLPRPTRAITERKILLPELVATINLSLGAPDISTLLYRQVQGFREYTRYQIETLGILPAPIKTGTATSAKDEQSQAHLVKENSLRLRLTSIKNEAAALSERIGLMYSQNKISLKQKENWKTHLALSVEAVRGRENRVAQAEQVPIEQIPGFTPIREIELTPPTTRTCSQIHL